MLVQKNGEELRRFVRDGQNWKQGVGPRNLELVTDREALEAVFAEFETLKVTRPALANAAGKAQVGLDAPRLRVEFTLQAPGQETTETKVLLVGAPYDGNDFELWATSESNGQPHDKLGTLFNQPLRALAEYLEREKAPVDFR